MKKGSKVLELTPIVETSVQFRLPFWRIASILKIEYYVQFCKTIHRQESDFYSRDIEVDITALKATIQLMFK
jgi:hypothetical protein